MADAPKLLTPDDVDEECDKVRDFFNRLPVDLRASAGHALIHEILKWASQSTCEAMGICMEAMLFYRDSAAEAEAHQCPHGHAFGKDVDQHPECDGCANWDDCEGASDDEHGPHDEVPSDLPPGV